MVDQVKYTRLVRVYEAEKAVKIEEVVKFAEQLIKDAETAKKLIKDVKVDPDNIGNYGWWLEGVSDNMTKAVTAMRGVTDEDRKLRLLKYLSE